jgi:hypothetical protein
VNTPCSCKWRIINCGRKIELLQPIIVSDPNLIHVPKPTFQARPNKRKNTYQILPLVKGIFYIFPRAREIIICVIILFHKLFLEIKF